MAGTPADPPILHDETAPELQDTPAGGETSSRNPLDVVFRLPGAGYVAGKLGPAEVRRRLLHMTPGLLPFVLWLYPHEYPWELPVRVWVAGLAMLLGFFGLKHFRSIARSGEQSGEESVLTYAFSVLGTLAIAPAHPEYTLIVLTMLAFGDGSATLGGLLLGGPRLFWNRRKTWTGLFCFWACGTMMATVVYWGEVRPTPSWSASFEIAAVIALAAALAESLPLRSNDNLRVGIATVVAAFAVVEQEYRTLKMLVVASVVLLIAGYIRSRRRLAETSAAGPPE